MVTIERLAPQNALILKDVRLRALRDTPTAFSSTYAEESRLGDADWFARAEQWTSDGSAVYLAMDFNVPCGIAAGFIERDIPGHAHLASMWVAATHRRLGIGSRLVEAIIAWSSARRLDSLQLTVTGNNDPAIRFYERLGFKLTGRTKPYRNDPTLTDLEMARSVPRT
jgi:ribosomal protein S18 acetylase RimI-like enzyme